MESANVSRASSVSDVRSESGWEGETSRPSYSSGFSMTLGELLEAGLGDKPSRAELAAAARKAKKNAKKGSGTTNTSELLPPPEPLVVPPLAKKWAAEHVRTFMQSLASKGVTPLEAIQRDPRDPHFKKEGGVANLMTYHQTYTSVDKDKDMFSNLAGLSEDFPVELRNQVRRELEESNQWIMTNGPSSGLFTRLQAGLERKKPLFKVDDYLPWVERFFPVRRANLRNLKGMGARDLKWVRIDRDTGYGAPFFRPKVSTEGNYLPQMMAIAGEIMHAIATGTIDKWCTAHPALCVALLRNKLDKYLREETAKKIRPYYTYPAHWNVLFSAIWQSVSDAAVTFLEDDSSINAHKFSWARGGAQKLYNWIVSKTTPGVYIAAYSDDQLWVIVTKDGRKYLMFPDYKMMDMSLGVSFGKLTYAFLVKIYDGVWDETWKAVAQLNCRFAFQKVVLVCFALVYLINGGLGSGIPGTAEFDQVASCAAARFVKEFLSDLADKTALDNVLPALCKRLQDRLGLEIKGETLAVHEFLPDQDYPWFMFLGHALRKVQFNGKQTYVPVRPREKLILSYVQPKGSYSKDGTARIRGLMQRLIGITASGGWYYDEMYFSAKRMYEMYGHKFKYTPAPENDMSYADFTVRPCAVPTPEWTAKDFPPKEWFQSVVTGWEVQVEHAAPPAKLVDLGTVWAVSDRWADSLDHDPFDDDKGAANVQPPPSSRHPEKQGQVEPLPQALKDEYSKRMLALKGALRAQHRAGGVLAPAKKPPKKGGKLQAYLEAHEEAWEAELDEAAEEDEYSPAVEEIPDEVLEEMHRERMGGEDLEAAYVEATRSRRRRAHRELPPWVAPGAEEP